MSNEEKKKRCSFRCSVLSTATTSSWNTTIESLVNSTGISQSRTTTTSSSAAAASAVPMGLAATVPMASTASGSQQQLSIVHKMVGTKRYIGFKKCTHCRRFLMYLAVKKQEEIFCCEVCGIRVHEGCLDRLTQNCLITSQYVGGLVQSAVIRSNKKRWDPTTVVTTTATTPCSPISSPQTPSTSFNKYVNSAMTMTTSTIGDFDTPDDIEKMMTWEDVTIEPDDVQFKGRIGEGRFGTVHFAHYHGDAAAKFVNMDYLEEERRVEAFKSEVVSAYKNCRHDHIALFLGYLADPSTNRYAIVTNFYHNKTLYHRIHESSEDFENTWALTISLQICHAMSYLHKKKILHKDLRSKNILLDKANKVVVADFALMKLERLAVPRRNYSMIIPNHWIDYMAPEIAGNLVIEADEVLVNGPELPFTGESDVYSFGTIFFELLMRKMPTASMPWEIKIYEKIIGTKAALCRVDSQTQRIDTKCTELLMKCWNYQPTSRPSFPQVVKSLTSLIRRKESAARRSQAHENPYF